ncbi:hypothetical protein [Actinokineospora sp. UTMC 2448]|uniref:hypothetical protein n=1 Tax=Actinokineospora sp. UTMC 2448 TaxID=2268449 RepID=UPI00216454AF|nr:hypothetical protein [Actinokineospora sp. UTMC 2448]UVS82677.1 hypothetical protein Actkin_06451 [Actinokineospora sp. UTMC 2448]
MDPVRTGRTATRRLFARALLVLGGAAAAWALGTATAAADTGVDLVADLGAVVESAPERVLAHDGVAVVESALTHLHVEDGAKAAVDRFDEVGETVAEHFGHAAPGQQVDDLLPSLPDLSPLPGSAAADGPLAVAPEPGRPVAVPAAGGQRHGEPGASADTSADARSVTRRGPPESSVEKPITQHGNGTPLAPLTLPAPAHSGHTGASTGDAPQSGLLSTAPLATEPALAHTPSAARADEPAAVPAQPGVTPD